MELLPGIHRITVPFGDRTNAVHLLVGSRRSMLVDTTTKDTAAEVLDQCAAAGIDSPTWTLTTHSDWDHAAGNGVIRDRCPASLLVCHQADRAMIENVEKMISDRYGEFADDHGYDETDQAKQVIRAGTSATAIDLTVVGDEEFDLGDRRVRVLHTPGHSPGSISVHDPDNSALIVGDAVLGDAVPFSDGRPAFPPTYRFLDAYRETIGRLQDLAPEVLLTGHYPVFSGSDAGRFLQRSREFTDEVESALTRVLTDAAEPVGLLEVAGRLSSELGAWPAAAAPALLFPLHGHLERHLRAGTVQSVREPGDSITRYRWTGTT